MTVHSHNDVIKYHFDVAKSGKENEDASIFSMQYRGVKTTFVVIYVLNVFYFRCLQKTKWNCVTSSSPATTTTTNENNVSDHLKTTKSVWISERMYLRINNMIHAQMLRKRRILLQNLSFSLFFSASLDIIWKEIDTHL